MKNSVIELIESIRKRPTMFLGRSSIACLRSFIDGWNHRKPESVIDGEIIGEFQEWIEARYNLKNTQSWDRIILFYSVDEHDALENFFRLFNQFLQQR